MPVNAVCAKVVVSHATKAPPGTGFNQVLQEVAKQKVSEPTLPELDRAQKASPVQQIVSSITRSEDRLRDLVHKSLNTKVESSPEKLLALQDSVYKTTFVIDVVAKSVEQATSGFKTLMQSQI